MHRSTLPFAAVCQRSTDIDGISMTWRAVRDSNARPVPGFFGFFWRRLASRIDFFEKLTETRCGWMGGGVVASCTMLGVCRRCRREQLTSHGLHPDVGFCSKPASAVSGTLSGATSQRLRIDPSPY